MYKGKLTRHHIIPRSRGGRNLESNLAYIPEREHRFYHALFENRTPEEIGSYLQKVFWNDMYQVEVRQCQR